MRRSFNSYQNLKREISWENDRKPRYFDDSYLGNCISPRLTRFAESNRSQNVEGDQENGSDDEKNLEVGASGKHTSEDSIPSPEETIPPSPPAAPLVSLQPPTPDLSTGAKDSKQEYKSFRQRGRRMRRKAAKEAKSPPPSPPPFPDVGQQDLGEESAMSTPKKRGGMTKEIILTICHQSKMENNQKRRSHENLEDSVHPPNPSFPPPPPPPSPPPSIFHNLFSSKKGKACKHPSSASPPPPPPPRRRSSASHSIANFTKAKTRFTPTTFTNRTNFNLIDQIVDGGSESPLISITPPPPPPPFKLRSWKFAVKGDYVKITSNSKSGGDDSRWRTMMLAPRWRLKIRIRCSHVPTRM